MVNVLIVEDEIPISNLMKMSLKKSGYQCTCAYDGSTAIDMIEETIFDLILLDIMLPGASGYEVLEYVKPLKIPVIFITAKNSVNDRVKGLKMGAEDYIVKPFEIVELLARVEVVLRRYQKIDSIIEVCGLTIDTTAMVVKRGEEVIPLTYKEYELLLLFVQNPGVALYRETIYERVWGGDYPCDSRTVALHVQRMRKKLGLEHNIKTIKKIGYRWENTN
ncbi:MAG: response regulator transcription factor [Lachnospiraceae bacterium]|nr:response regulator transcription factor [Lachnospiraceae bacterium]